MIDQISTVSGIVQINGQPASRIVRAFSYDAVHHEVDGTPVLAARTLGETKSDPETGAYNIDLLGSYSGEVFVVAFDDYGREFAPNLPLAIGDRVHPTQPNGYVYECDAPGALPEEEPVWSTDTGTSQLIGTASVRPFPFYRPVVHGPIKPEVTNAPVDIYFDNVVTLLHFDGPYGSTTFTDEKGRVWTAYGDASISQDSPKFGNGCVSFSSGSSYLRTNDSADFDFKGEPFTIEAFVRLNVNPASNTTYSFLGKGYGVGVGEASFALEWYNGPRFRIWNPGSEMQTAGSVNMSAIPGQWMHVAAVRYPDKSYALFLNGEKVSTQNNLPGDIATTDAPLHIGKLYANITHNNHCSIDELRITKGIARYTENFTPPAEPFPNQGAGQVSAQYWRLRFTANNGGAETIVPFIQFVANNGGSHNKNVTILATENKALAPFAFKGDLGAPHWSAGLGAAIGCAFEAAESVTHVQVWAPLAEADLAKMPRDFVIEHSVNGSTWQTLHSAQGVADWEVGQPKTFTIQNVARDEIHYRDWIASYNPTAFWDIAGGMGGVSLGTVGGMTISSPYISARSGVLGISRPTSTAGTAKASDLLPGTDYTAIYFCASTRTSFTALGGINDGSGTGQSAILYTQWSTGDDWLIQHQIGTTPTTRAVQIPNLSDGQWHLVALTRKNGILEGYCDGQRVQIQTNLPADTPIRDVSNKVTFLVEADGGYPSPNEASHLGMMAFIPAYLSESEMVALMRQIMTEYGLN